jgi:hypothetical protein
MVVCSGRVPMIAAICAGVAPAPGKIVSRLFRPPH